MILRNTFLPLLLICVCGFPYTNQYKQFFLYDEFDYDERGTLIPECETALENFAESTSNYTLCIIKYSRPIRACKYCVDPYMEVRMAHEKILNLEVNGTQCKSLLINLDRLEIIESTFNNVQDIWNRGYCDTCFDWPKGKPVVSNKTKNFFAVYKTATDCIREHKINNNNTDQICKNCMDKYMKLNTYYESLKTTSETVGICMDIVDSMNATRSVWSDELNCCKLRRTPEVVFLCCTAFITSLPAIFYLFARYYCENVSQLIPAEQNRMIQSLRNRPSASQSVQR